MILTSCCLLPLIIVNSTPVFFTLSTFTRVFWNNFYYFKSARETCASICYLPLFSSSNYLNTLARLIYQSRLFQHGSIRPTNFISWLKIFLKKGGLPQLLFDRLSTESNNEKSYQYLMVTVTAVSRPQTRPIIGPFVLFQTTIILKTGLSVRPKSVGPSQFTITGENSRSAVTEN